MFFLLYGESRYMSKISRIEQITPSLFLSNIQRLYIDFHRALFQRPKLSRLFNTGIPNTFHILVIIRFPDSYFFSPFMKSRNAKTPYRAVTPKSSKNVPIEKL